MSEGRAGRPEWLRSPKENVPEIPTQKIGSSTALRARYRNPVSRTPEQPVVRLIRFRDIRFMPTTWSH